MRPLDSAKIDELTAEVATLLEREEANAAAEEARMAEALAWGRYWHRKLGDVKKFWQSVKFWRVMIAKYDLVSLGPSVALVLASATLGRGDSL